MQPWYKTTSFGFISFEVAGNELWCEFHNNPKEKTNLIDFESVLNTWNEPYIVDTKYIIL